MWYLLHHIHGVDPVAADEAPRVGCKAADVPDNQRSLHGLDLCTHARHKTGYKRHHHKYLQALKH